MDFLLDPDMTFLNHGSYGACPAPVFERYQELQRELERNPVEFLGRRFDELTAEARAALAAFVGARPDDLVFVPNATSGLNAVIRSLRAGTGRRSADDPARVRRRRPHLGVRGRAARLCRAGRAGWCDRAADEGRLRQPHHLADRARPAGGGDLRRAREAGVLSIVDGAHAPGQVPLDLDALGADVYAGNCHKWLCAPKGAGFLWARPEHQRWIEPLVDLVGLRRRDDLRRAARLAGHARSGRRARGAGRDRRSRTFDLERCRRLAASFHDRLPPVGPTPAPQMWASEVDTNDPDGLQRRLFDEHRIEVVVREWEGRSLLARLDRALQRGGRRRAAARRAQRS